VLSSNVVIYLSAATAKLITSGAWVRIYGYPMKPCTWLLVKLFLIGYLIDSELEGLAEVEPAEQQKEFG